MMTDTFDRSGRPITGTEWAQLHTEEYKRVGLERYEGGVSVSTVWLGIDHSFGGGKPLIFETMIFGPESYPYNECMMRYASEAEAVMGHRRTCYDIEHGNRPWFLVSGEGEQMESKWRALQGGAMCEDAPCCGCCGVGPGGVMYSADYPLYEPEYHEYE